MKPVRLRTMGSEHRTLSGLTVVLLASFWLFLSLLASKWQYLGHLEAWMTLMIWSSRQNGQSEKSEYPKIYALKTTLTGVSQLSTLTSHAKETLRSKKWSALESYPTKTPQIILASSKFLASATTTRRATTRNSFSWWSISMQRVSIRNFSHSAIKRRNVQQVLALTLLRFPKHKDSLDSSLSYRLRASLRTVNLRQRGYLVCWQLSWALWL